MSAQPRCPSCRTQVESDDELCRNCGAALGAAITGDDEEESPAERISPKDKVAKALKRALSPRIEVLRRLGGGGMSTVYLGRDPALRRLVAIKVLSEDLANDPLARARFTREAETSAAISHPHVIEIYEVGTLPRSKTPYIVMEFVDGVTVQQEILSHGMVAEPFAKAVMGEVASALAAAHARGVVHRDIKPSNIIIGRETGHAVVLDFGIAAALDRSAPVGQEKLTLQGVSVGTPAYMSPEQAGAREVSDKSDVYCLGVVMFEFVSGRPPFLAEAPEGYLAAHLQEKPPDLRLLRPYLDGRLADLITRCLAKSPDDRPSADEIARAIQPPVRQTVEWPPPGLDLLRGAGWNQLTGLAGVGAAGLAFFATVLLAPQAPAGPQYGAGVWATLWLPLLVACALATGIMAVLALGRGWRLALLLRAGRAAKYPWTVVLDVAIDAGTDTAALINGHGAFAFLDRVQRRKLVQLKRLRAAAMLLGTILAMLGPLLWLGGLGSAPAAGATGWSSAFDVALFLLPSAVPFAAAALCGIPEWLVGRRRRPRRWFLPLPSSLRPVQPELVERWLGDQGQEVQEVVEEPVERSRPFVPLVGGALLSALLIAMLFLTVTAARTATRWSARAQGVAAAVLIDSRGSWTDLTGLAAESGRLPGQPAGPRLQRARGLAAALFGLGTDSTGHEAGSSATPPPVVGSGPARSLWRNLPASVDGETRAALVRDTSAGGLALWRRAAYAGPLPALWMYDDSLPAVAAVGGGLPLFRPGVVRRLAASNEAAALLHMARADADQAVTRGRENIAIGALLLADPVHGWLAADVIATGRAIVGEIGLLTDDRDLLLETERLRAALDAVDTPALRTPWFGAALNVDPLAPRARQVLSDTLRPSFVRWWAVGGIVPGFCGSAREILFGVSAERRAALERARVLAGDIPRVEEWVRVNERRLESWIEGAPSTKQKVPLSLFPFRLMGLGGVAHRITYCRRAIERF